MSADWGPRDRESLLARRRAAAAVARRRRLVLLDVGLALLAALLVLVLGPGLAIAALVAMGVVLVCGIALLLARRRQGADRPPRGRSAAR